MKNDFIGINELFKRTMKYIFQFAVALFLMSIILGIFLQSCKKKTSFNEDGKLTVVLKYSGNNAAELQKAIDHYSIDVKDSLKLKAACFLIENMIGKGSVHYNELENGNLCSYDLFKSNIGVDSICLLKKRYEDSVGGGKIVFADPSFKEDVKMVTSAELIQNIEYAFKAWQFPWAKHLSFNQFKELILPYRVEQEPLQNWREYFFKHSNWIFNRIGNSTDRIKIAGVINDSLKKNYKYIHNAITFFPGSFTVKQLKAMGGGRCADLNMLAGYWLRAIGIPTAAEFTPYWSNSNTGGHSWLSILDTNGKFVPMNAIYDNPVRDSLPFKDAYLAKAFRSTYEISTVHFEQQEYAHNFYDITAEYLPTIDYSMTTSFPISSTAYIGVLNGSFWKPLETETIQKGREITFKTIARNVLYAPIIILDRNKTVTIGRPFFVYKSGKVHSFVENKNKLTDISIDVSSLINNVYGKKCQVVYWDDQLKNWIPTGEPKYLTDDPKVTVLKKAKTYVIFKNVISGAIYRIIDSNSIPNGISYGRPFIYVEDVNGYIDY